MPLPLFIAIPAVIAGITGVGAGIHGGIKMKDANDTINFANRMQNKAVDKLDTETEKILKITDGIGTTEMELISSFNRFSDWIDKIHNRPDFSDFDFEAFDIPNIEVDELKKMSVGADALLATLGSAAAGTAGGFAAAGATTSIVAALGTASTGTAISSLSGAAATSATLSVLGGGTTALGGGGVALGTTVLGAASLGVGLLIGGMIFSFTGAKLSDKADQAYKQAKENCEKIDKICSFYDELYEYSVKFRDCLDRLKKVYDEHLAVLKHIVEFEEKTEWDQLDKKERASVKNTCLLVGIVFNVCKVKLVIQSEKEDGVNYVNKEDISSAVENANSFMDQL